MSYLFPNHFSGKLFDYSLFLQLMISNERPFEWYMWQYLEKKLSFLPVSDDVSFISYIKL